MTDYLHFFDSMSLCPTCDVPREIVPDVFGNYFTTSDINIFTYDKFGFNIEFDMVTKQQLGSQILKGVIEYKSYHGITFRAFNRFNEEIDKYLGISSIIFNAACDNCIESKCESTEHLLDSYKENFIPDIYFYVFCYENVKIYSYPSNNKVYFTFKKNDNEICKRYENKDLTDYEFLTNEYDKIIKTLILG